MPVPLPTSSLPITFRTPAQGLPGPSTTCQAPLPLKDIQPTPINTSQPLHTSTPTQSAKKAPHYHLSLPDAYNAASSNNTAPPPPADIHPMPLPEPCPSGRGFGAQKPSTPTAQPLEHPAPPDCPPLEDVQKRRKLADPKAIAAAQAQLALHLWKARDQQSMPAEAAYTSGPAPYAIRAPAPRQAFLEALAQAGLGEEQEGDSRRGSLKSASPEDDTGIPNMETEATSHSLGKSLPKPGSRDSDLIGPSQTALGK